MYPRTWVEVSRPALIANLERVRRGLAGGTRVCAVVKADAYGHGAVACARVLENAGVDWFAVTNMEEGARLRGAGIRGRILVLAGFWSGEVAELIEYRLTPAVWDVTQIEWLGRALHPNERLPIHLKIESGMGRLGITPPQEGSVLAALGHYPGLEVEAMFTHLSASESADAGTSQMQLEKFREAAARLRPHLGDKPWHLLNSAGAQRFGDWGGMLVRVGLSLYGYGGEVNPALTWKTRLIAIKDLPAGHGVGYGAQFRTPAAMRVATIGVGYADGYRRDFWPGAKVLVRDTLVPVIGNISMDMTTVDISEVPDATLGDEVGLIGPRFHAGDLAAIANTVPYEILCGISARVDRSYLG